MRDILCINCGNALGPDAVKKIEDHQYSMFVCPLCGLINEFNFNGLKYEPARLVFEIESPSSNNTPLTSWQWSKTPCAYSIISKAEFQQLSNEDQALFQKKWDGIPLSKEENDKYSKKYASLCQNLSLSHITAHFILGGSL